MLFQAELDEKLAATDRALEAAAQAGDAAAALAAAAAAAPPAPTALTEAARALHRAIVAGVVPAQRVAADRREAMDLVEASGANAVPEVQRALGRLASAKTRLRAARVAAGVSLAWQAEQDFRPPSEDGGGDASGPALGDIAMPLAPPIRCAATGRVLLHAGMGPAEMWPRAVSTERPGLSVGREAYGLLARVARGAGGLARVAAVCGDATASAAAAAALGAARQLDPDLADGGM